MWSSLFSFIMDYLALGLALLLSSLLFALLVKLYAKMTTGWCKEETDMTGKVAIITGGSSGIGKETARALARRNAKVILACRNLKKANEAAEDIGVSTGNPNIVVKFCDLASQKSIRAFCSEICETESRLDVLILNAGMVPPPGRYLTEDFLEVQFASNHLGHFLLTNLLLDLLIRSAPSRIIVVSSLLHVFGKIPFDNLNFEKHIPDPFFTYCNSKLANILFIKELTRRLEGTMVTANALHPGLVKTQINRETPWYLKNVIQPVAYIWAKSPTEGAQTSIHLAVSKEVENISGKYFLDCKIAECSRRANDPQLAAKLWDVSEELTGLKQCSS